MQLCEIDMPGFLEKHRKDFVDWRYLPEQSSLTGSPSEFDNALAVLVEACKPGSRSIRLFDEFERRHAGGAPPGELLYDYVNHSALPEAAQVRELCERWFRDYSREAPERALSDFRWRFRVFGDDRRYAAWFELLTHQILVRLGFSVSLRPSLRGPVSWGFATTSGGSRILVEATVAAPYAEPFVLSRFEDDALQKVAPLVPENIRASIKIGGGTLNRFLACEEIERDFQRFFDEHGPDEVQQLYDKSGPFQLPTETFSFDGWRLRVTLFPPRRSVNSAELQGQIMDELRAYGPTDDPLILVANVSNRLGFHPFVHGHEILLGKNGFWNWQHPQRDGLAAVIFVPNTNAYAAAYAQPCLFVNPSVDPDALPPALLRLPRVQGPNGSERIEGESVASILGLD